jgi:regulator of vacuolar morphogenesis
MPYTLSIPSATVAPDASSKPYTVYNLIVATPLRTSTLPKRYSDFSTLHTTLTSSVGAAPPAPLPAKSWFKRTINDPSLTEDRRYGLETYVLAIEDADDPKWRNSKPWREFLGLPPLPETQSKEDGRRGSLPAAQQQSVMGANQWLDLHAQLKTLLHEARTLLSKREHAPSTAAQHEASAGAKKGLVKANTLILRLEAGLGELAEGRAGGEKLGEGEVRRRRDLLSRARQEREGLEGVLNAWVVSKANATTVLASDPQKDGLFDGASNAGNGIPGAFPSGPQQQRVASSSRRRVLGGPPAKETERTRELDNEGVLKLQQQIMKEQDTDVEDLTKVVRRMKEMGIAINEELVEQGQLLDMLDQDVDRVSGKVEIAKKRVSKIS